MTYLKIVILYLLLHLVTKSWIMVKLASYHKDPLPATLTWLLFYLSNWCLSYKIFNQQKPLKNPFPIPPHFAFSYTILQFLNFSLPLHFIYVLFQISPSFPFIPLLIIFVHTSFFLSCAFRMKGWLWNKPIFWRTTDESRRVRALDQCASWVMAVCKDSHWSFVQL